jgi:hypothetical protein
MGAMDYFDDQRRVIEASQARLILAWCQALSRDVMAVTIMVSRLEADLGQIGHVRHLARLYQTSLALLGGWWQAQTVAAMEHVLDASRFLGGVRVYAFGVPQVYLQGGELIQRDRYGRAGIRLLIYMLEKRQATLWEIVEALWEGGDPQSGQKRFHDLMSNFKKTIGSPDWCVYSQERRVYVVKEGFPDYYDASDFKMTYAWFTSSEDTMQSLAQALKLINLYDTFAKTFEGDAFDDLRHEYDALFDHMIGQSEQLLPALADRVPRNWYQRQPFGLKSPLLDDSPSG